MKADAIGEAAVDGEAPASYNRVFAFYVEEDENRIDLVGLIAYALYKRQKRDWLIAYRKEHAGGGPSDIETSALTGGYMTGDARQTYRERAADLLNGYAEVVVEGRTPAIRESAVNNETLRQADSIRKSIESKSGLWPSVWSGILATALWTLLVTILAAAIGPDVLRAIATALSSH